MISKLFNRLPFVHTLEERKQIKADAKRRKMTLAAHVRDRLGLAPAKRGRPPKAKK